LLTPFIFCFLIPCISFCFVVTALVCWKLWNRSQTRDQENARVAETGKPLRNSFTWLLCSYSAQYSFSFSPTWCCRFGNCGSKVSKMKKSEFLNYLFKESYPPIKSKHLDLMCKKWKSCLSLVFWVIQSSKLKSL
jgi:hypothetical protein